MGVMFTIFMATYLYLLLMRISLLLRNNEYLFESYVAFLVANFIYVQFLLNIGVNYGLLPTKGITLPFMGYGGTSVVSHIVMIGMVLSFRKLPVKEKINSARGPVANMQGLVPAR